MNAHTPGPWSVEVEADTADEQADIYVVHPGTVCDVSVVCTMARTAYVSTDQKIADAHLIAAALDLYVALSKLRAVAEATTFSDQYPAECEAARAALAKARGEAA